jgi:hypothetical protein
MTDAAEVVETLETIAGHIAQVAAPLAKSIDAVAFGGDPPRVVTFLAIDEATHRGHPPGPNRAEMIENIEYADGLLFPRGAPDDIDIGSFRLIDGVAQVIRKVATKITGESEAEAADTMSRALAVQVVFAAWLVREQLLVVDLALALDIDPIPLPSLLNGGGDD